MKFTIEQIDVVKTMTDQCKYIMVLRYIENLSPEKISRIMGMPQHNIEYIIKKFTKRVMEKNNIESEK